MLCRRRYPFGSNVLKAIARGSNGNSISAGHSEVDAIVADATKLEYYAHSGPERNVTVDIFHPDKYGFAYPADSDPIKPVTVQILGLHEDWTIARLRLKYFGNTP